MGRHGLLLSIACCLALVACSTEEKDPPTAPTGAWGALALKLSFAPASPFKSIAKRGTITVSAADMSPIASPLDIGDSTVTGEVSKIPTGKNRSIVLKVLDIDGALAYQGSGLADIFPDSTTQVAIDLVRSTGSAEIVGTIKEDTASTPWPTSMTLPLGAQASPVLGAVLDVDSGQVWTSAKANANQGGIDLVFLYYNSGFHLDNAVDAKAAGIAYNINLTNSYDVTRIKEVRIVKVASRPPDQESAKRTFASGSKIGGSAIVGGEIFLVESTEGRLAMVTVLGFMGTGNAGQVNLRLERSTIP